MSKYTISLESKPILQKKHDKFISVKTKELETIGVVIVFTEEQRDEILKNAKCKAKVIYMPPLIKIIKEK